jgi:hypothetical protein
MERETKVKTLIAVIGIVFVVVMIGLTYPEFLGLPPNSGETDVGDEEGSNIDIRGGFPELNGDSYTDGEMVVTVSYAGGHWRLTFEGYGYIDILSMSIVSNWIGFDNIEIYSGSSVTLDFLTTINVYGNVPAGTYVDPELEIYALSGSFSVLAVFDGDEYPYTFDVTDTWLNFTIAGSFNVPSLPDQLVIPISLADIVFMFMF